MDVPVISLVTHSGWVSRIIFIILFLFSITGWAIIINRFVYLRWASKMHKAFKEKFRTMANLAEVESLGADVLKSPLGLIGKVGVEEYRRIIADAQTHTGVKDWSFFFENQFSMVKERLATESNAGSAQLDKAVFMLAIISSAAPFVGLLGTVWGIMDSFFQIGQQGSASLPVVAPGIAEALIATAFALAVAIPAVFFYNVFNHRIDRLETEMDDYRDLIILRLKREILALLFTVKQRSAQTPGNITL